MPGEKPRGAKTLTLSLRLDPKTKFILDFVARIKGQSITTVVERAIKETADGLGIGPEWDEEGSKAYKPTWSEFWDASEGVRTLKLLGNAYYPTSFDEDELKAFTVAHSDFFYTKGTEPRRGYLEILWPRMEKYIEIWREKKSTDYWAAGEAMKADLLAARVNPPNWPPIAAPQLKAAPQSKPTPQASAPAPPPDFDDEIPF